MRKPDATSDGRGSEGTGAETEPEAAPQLTPEIQDRICALIRMCTPLAVAGAAVVGKDAFHRWLAWGEEGRTAEYVDFVHAVHRAEAEGEVLCVAQISNAARHDWRAAAWLLERRWPEHWAQGKQETRGVADEPVEAVRVIFEGGPWDRSEEDSNDDAREAA